MVESVLSLFSGAGGAVEGFKQAGYDVVTAVDFDEDCIDTLEANYDDVRAIQENLIEVGPEEFAGRYDINPEDVDVVVGGPPCKDFSKAQSDRTTEGERANLVFRFAEYVRFYQPDVFVMENVDALTTIDDGDFFSNLLDVFEDGGYSTEYDILHAEKYGVPQKRRRTVVVGGLNGTPELPTPSTPEPISVSEALDDLPNLEAGEESDVADHNAISHREETIEKLKDAPHGQAKHPAYARAYPDEPAFTVVGGKASPPVHHEQTRRLTVRECARLQTFPDDFTFTGSRMRKYQMVGNSMPVELARVVADSL